MPDLHSSTAAFRSDTKGLLKLLELDGSTPDGWQTEDLAAMVRHQLAAPIRTDLWQSNLDEVQRKGLEQILSQGAGMDILSFRDLLLHRSPPVELLRKSKEFFKKNSTCHKEGSPERKVEFLFYFLFILKAKQHGQNISKLSRGRLLEFSGWALRQDWVDRTIKQLLVQSQQQLRDETRG